jgi:pre-peptidase
MDDAKESPAVSRHLIPTATILFPFALAAACGDGEAPVAAEGHDPFSSAIATLMIFDFDGEVVASSSWSAERMIQDQMLYTIGQLNGSRSVGRLDNLQLTNVMTTAIGSEYRITYHARLPVAWGSKTNLPSSYGFILPRSISGDAQQSFTDKYGSTCTDPSAHDLTAGSMWYYYRPRRASCSLDDADVVRLTASAVRGEDNTAGKYPEYHKIWEDHALQVIAIFGKYEDGATADDAGIDAYNSFVSLIRSEFGSSATIEPEDTPTDPGASHPDVTLRAARDGHAVEIHALLVDNVRTAGPAFDRRYNELSTEADMIFYNGHAGLGQNVRALVRKGQFRAGKYQIIFMNGCDTFAYVDGSLAQARALLNPDDPTGTKYMDIITNAEPSFFSSNASNDLALIRGILDVSSPKTYDQIFRSIDRSQIVVVTGEEDNVYYPGYEPGGGGGGGAWMGLKEGGAIARDEEKRYASPELEPGDYVFSISGEGDADLYVKTGTAPTTTDYDCRPYEDTSNETCSVTLSARGVIHAMVRGYAPSSTYMLIGRPR